MNDVDKLMTEILGERPNVKDRALRELVMTRMKAGGEVKMGKGGLLKKAAKAVSEAVEIVLPTAERQANLERFLEGSATKQRLYHGTNKDISTFESGRPVQWLAENPELANQFVAGGRRKMGSKPSKGSVVYPVYAKAKNLLDLTDATPQKAISTVDFLKQAGVDTSPENLRRLAEWDYELNKAYGGGSHLEDPVGSRIERMQYPEPLWSLLDRRMVIKALEDQGYDGVKLTEKFGNKEPYGESQTIGVFNPANIKSATGNVGTYDVGATDITKSKGGVIKSLAKAIAKELPEAKASQRTQIPGTEPTYRKAYDILEREKPGGRTLDYGAGLGHGSRLMGAESFEPFPREGFKPDFIRPEDIPTEEFDRLVNLNVLNVMPREMRDATVENIGRVMRPGGMGIVTTRGRDVLNAAGEAGPEPMSKITSIGTYQKGFLPEELRQYLEYILGRDYNVSKLGLGPAGAVVRKKGKAEGGEIKRADGGAIGKNVGRGMAGLTRSRQPLDPKEIQAMMLDIPAGLGVPFAEAGAEYLRGNIEDAKTSAAIDAALTAVPAVGALAKPAYRAVKGAVQKYAKGGPVKGFLADAIKSVVKKLGDDAAKAKAKPIATESVVNTAVNKAAERIAKDNPKLSESEIAKKAEREALAKLKWERSQKPELEARYGPLEAAKYSDPLAKRQRNVPEAVEARIERARNFLSQPTEPWKPPRPELQAFDRSLIKEALEGFPGVEQTRFPRYSAPRSDLEYINEIYDDPRNRELIEAQIKRGLPLGGETFYASLYPLKVATLERGMAPGKFEQFVYETAPASARNSILNEMAAGQFLRDMKARGLPLDEETVAREMALFKEKYGKGLPLMPIHREGVRKIIEGGEDMRQSVIADIPTNYKIPTYGTQKAGDFAKSVVLDVHEAAGETLGSRYHPYFTEQGGFGPSEYGPAEAKMLDIAENLGIPGGMAQAGRWFGGGELTGLKSPRGDALDLLEKQTAFTLQGMGVNPTPRNVRNYILDMVETGRGVLMPWFKGEGMPDVRVEKKKGGLVAKGALPKKRA